jgi:adenine deaminase
MTPSQLITRSFVEEVTVQDGLAVADPNRDLLKIAVIERHLASGNMGKGFIRGFGLKRGAIASSVAHDSHNIVVIGTNDKDMLQAVRAIIAMRGGLSIVENEQVLGRLPLPIAGLMSDQPLGQVRNTLNRLLDIAGDLGSTVRDPFMAMSFMALPVIPELKLTDKGLVDTNQFKLIPLFER